MWAFTETFKRKLGTTWNLFPDCWSRLIPGDFQEREISPNRRSVSRRSSSSEISWMVTAPVTVDG